MAKYKSKINAKISDETKATLEAIKKENNDITIRYILEDFIKGYCETNPKGVKLKIKKFEKEIKEIVNQINILHEKKIKLEIELKTYKDKLNKTLDIYIDEDLIKAVNSVIEITNQKNIERFEDIPDVTFVNIAKYNKIDLEKLKEEVKKEFN
jgi:hypothetical protein